MIYFYIMITINNKFQIERMRQKKSCYRLAKDAGVTVGTVYNFEKGKSISTATLEKLAKALDIELTFKAK